MGIARERESSNGQLLLVFVADRCPAVERLIAGVSIRDNDQGRRGGQSRRRMAGIESLTRLTQDLTG